MKAPVCRLCESARWSNEPHKFAGEAETVAQVRKDLAMMVTCNHCVTKDMEICRLDAEIERLRNQLVDALKPVKAKRDRAAYMREYRKQA